VAQASWELREGVPQVSNLLYRRLPVGSAWAFRTLPNWHQPCGLEIRDTRLPGGGQAADWKSAARASANLQAPWEVREVLECGSPLPLFFGAWPWRVSAAGQGWRLNNAKAPEDWRTPQRWRVFASAFLINTPLQRGDGRPGKKTQRF